MCTKYFYAVAPSRNKNIWCIHPHKSYATSKVLGLQFSGNFFLFVIDKYTSLEKCSAKFPFKNIFIVAAKKCNVRCDVVWSTYFLNWWCGSREKNNFRVGHDLFYSCIFFLNKIKYVVTYVWFIIPANYY